MKSMNFNYFSHLIANINEYPYFMRMKTMRTRLAQILFLGYHNESLMKILLDIILFFKQLLVYKFFVNSSHYNFIQKERIIFQIFTSF